MMTAFRKSSSTYPIAKPNGMGLHILKCILKSTTFLGFGFWCWPVCKHSAKIQTIQINCDQKCQGKEISVFHIRHTQYMRLEFQVPNGIRHFETWWHDICELDSNHALLEIDFKSKSNPSHRPMYDPASRHCSFSQGQTCRGSSRPSIQRNKASVSRRDCLVGNVLIVSWSVILISSCHYKWVAI